MVTTDVSSSNMAFFRSRHERHSVARRYAQAGAITVEIGEMEESHQDLAPDVS
jgi:hypothetical protein